MWLKSKQQEVIHITNRPDSLEIGTPGKGGSLKIYFDSSREQEADELIRSAYRRLELARQLQEQVR
jgi:hypothetical protein